MPRPIERLSALGLSKLTKRKGVFCDGGGLYLHSDPPTQSSWLFRYRLSGKTRWMGLGPYPAISLAKARELAANARTLKALGTDPIEKRDASRAAAHLAAAKLITFRQCAESYIKAHRVGWRNAAHASQWENTLRAYAYPQIGALSVQAIDTSLVMRVLEPIWTAKPETASRLRGRIETILNWARVRGFREGENPARWRGHLDHLLPAKSKVRRVQHHAAMPYAELPDFMSALREQDSVAARALEFLVLTAARTGEVTGARWREIDLKNRLWTVPAERMKAGKPHRVPLCPRAVAILEAIKPERVAGDAFVFPGNRPQKPQSNMVFLMLLRRMKLGHLTAHGFRATFKTWATERTNFPREVVEAALAHVAGDKIEAAYQRGDVFDKRRKLMEAWTAYCASTTAAATAKVVLIREAAP
jgi:integrase